MGEGGKRKSGGEAGLTPLMVAVRYGADAEVVRATISSGRGDANEVSANDGATPLLMALTHMAASPNLLGVVKELLKSGADPNYEQPGTGLTPMAAAIKHEAPREVVAALVKGGAKVQSQWNLADLSLDEGAAPGTEGTAAKARDDASGGDKAPKRPITVTVVTKVPSRYSAAGHSSALHPAGAPNNSITLAMAPNPAKSSNPGAVTLKGLNPRDVVALNVEFLAQEVRRKAESMQAAKADMFSDNEAMEMAHFFLAQRNISVNFGKANKGLPLTSTRAVWEAYGLTEALPVPNYIYKQNGIVNIGNREVERSKPVITPPAAATKDKGKKRSAAR